MMYASSFLAAFCATVFLMVIMILLGKKIPWRGRNSIRHSHNQKILRVGGAAMIVAFDLIVLCNSHLVMSVPLVGFLLANTLILIVGFWDDIKEISWKAQLIFQLLLVAIICLCGVRIYYISNFFSGGIIHLENGWGLYFSFLLIAFWVLLIINAINWIDGIDGLSGGITLIGILSIFLLCLKPEVNQPPMAIIAMILAGCVIGFLIFNFYPARVLAGTSGAMFMGFSLAMMGIFSGTKIATTLLVMIVPVIDFFWVILERIKNKKSIFKADKRHLHHKLLELGWTNIEIISSYYAITILAAIIALSTYQEKKLISIAIASVLSMFILFVINKKISCRE